MTVIEVKDRAKLLYLELRAKGKRYWLIVLLLLVVGTVVGEQLGEHGVWINLRYRLYAVLQHVVPSPTKGRWTALVLIDDDDYWKGPFARRTPLKRDYLAKLIKTVETAKPKVIALD